MSHERTLQSLSTPAKERDGGREKGGRERGREEGGGEREGGREDEEIWRLQLYHYDSLSCVDQPGGRKVEQSPP